MPGSLEHQMFEEVREPGASRLLARRADVVPHIDCHDGDGVVLVKDHVQPVGQGELRVSDFERGPALSLSKGRRRGLLCEDLDGNDRKK